MAHLKLNILFLLLAMAFFIQVSAQNSDTLQFPVQHLLSVNDISQYQFKNQVFSNPIVGEYQVGETGIMTRDGHQYFMRIKEPDMIQVIPMPNAQLKLQEHLNHNNDKTFYYLPRTLTPPIIKNR